MALKKVRQVSTGEAFYLHQELVNGKAAVSKDGDIIKCDYLEVGDWEDGIGPTGGDGSFKYGHLAVGTVYSSFANWLDRLGPR